MPAVRAERLCPEAIFVPPDFARYRAASRTAREIFLSYPEHVEPLSLDAAYLAVSETKRGLASANAVSQQISRETPEPLHTQPPAGVRPNTRTKGGPVGKE